MSVALFLYGFFLIVAFRYGRSLTGKNYLFWMGLTLGLSLMFLSPGVYLNRISAVYGAGALLVTLSFYQIFYLVKYRFFPAGVGLTLNGLMLLGLIIFILTGPVYSN